MLFSFVPPEEKQTRSHKWRARGKRQKTQRLLWCWLFLSISLWKKGHSTRSYHFLWDDLYQHSAVQGTAQPFWAPSQYSNKMQSWLPNADFEIGPQADRGEKRKQAEGGKKIRSRSPTRWKWRFQPDPFLRFPWLHNFFWDQVEDTHLSNLVVSGIREEPGQGSPDS